ncbi:hypothetical protein JW758_03865 [Candidatus Peregrinibacteria bacterium]|nr:hypothetical protein [Candidatus Peregrinibacteria bacterium]
MIYFNNYKEDLLLNKRFIFAAEKPSAQPESAKKSPDGKSIEGKVAKQAKETAQKAELALDDFDNKVAKPKKVLSGKEFAKLGIKEKALTGGRAAAKLGGTKLGNYTNEVIFDFVKVEGKKFTHRQLKTIVDSFENGFIQAKTELIKAEITDRAEAMARSGNLSAVALDQLVKEGSNADTLQYLNKKEKSNLREFAKNAVLDARKRYA